jgi:4-diphosphocytidyl-2-C-methyl-D-erythritol kinase
VKIRAPAKLNVRLRVVGKRRDGYHLLDTIMVPVSLYDELTIRKQASSRRQIVDNQIELTCDHPGVPAGEQNLVHRAAALFLENYQLAASLTIDIRKRIPVAAGLGGGSSDAAATLVGLNRLFRLKRTDNELRELAVQLGADVPFFISPSPARARGIGERLKPLDRFPRLWSVIVYPGFGVSTAWAFQHYRALTKSRSNTSMCSSLESPRAIAKLMTNDLEPVVLRRYPIIGKLKAELARDQAIGVLMSGSGSSVFGLFTTKRNAEDAFRRLRGKGAQAFLARILG